MILAGILAFGVMLAVGFIVGCGIAEAEIWMKEEREKEKHDER